MLHTYSAIDERVAALGRAVKAWAKGCRIVGTQNGMLNSYTYVLMVLFFLQRVQPAVVPNLQNVHETDRRKISQNGQAHDVSYVRYPSWKSKNRDTLTQLMVKFFQFYGVDFDWKNEVVSIRDGPNTTTKDHRDKIAWQIDDPFERQRNLASATTEQGRQKILIACRHALAMQHSKATSIQGLCTPMWQAERFFLRVPWKSDREMELVQILLKLFYDHLGHRAPSNCVVTEVSDNGRWQRDIFFEFRDKLGRYEAMSVAQRKMRPGYAYYTVSGDLFLSTVSEASRVYTPSYNPGAHIRSMAGMMHGHAA